jgi:hypothetical protein
MPAFRCAKPVLMIGSTPESATSCASNPAGAKAKTCKIQARYPDSEWEVRPVDGQECPHFAFDPEIDRVPEDLTHDAGIRGVDVEHMAD